MDGVMRMPGPTDRTERTNRTDSTDEHQRAAAVESSREVEMHMPASQPLAPMPAMYLTTSTNKSMKSHGGLQDSSSLTRLPRTILTLAPVPPFLPLQMIMENRM
ncbi:hypothetical protein J0S82_019321 [Galemys pyrenaicus]|uniref:Uncharacterized protein n=1 Tax=Galemys pyrenaicus TaxID=202257 RepID=A0A8J6DP79_GALPY|nr:hypothetical protein J0S82_019321 [Galemys pyrenaicus]